MILELLPEGTPSLKDAVPKFDFENPPIDPRVLADDLIETMNHHRAFGLAANQCGLPYRAFVLQGKSEGDSPLVFFNAEIVNQWESEAGDEGCLSFPDLELSVVRAVAVEVDYRGADGERRQVVLSDVHARGVQHELDHLNGVLFTTRVSRLMLERARKHRAKKARKAG